MKNIQQGQNMSENRIIFSSQQIDHAESTGVEIRNVIRLYHDGITHANYVRIS